MNEKTIKLNDNPLKKANFFSKIFIRWINPLINKKDKLKDSDLYDVMADQECSFLTNQIQKKLDRNFDLFKAFLSVYGYQLVLYTLMPLFDEILRCIQPFLILKFLLYFQNRIDFKSALVYGFLICLTTTITNSIQHPLFINMQKIGKKMRIACTGLLYKKVFKLSSHSLKNGAEILNLVTNDALKIENSITYLSYLIVTPIQIVFVIILIVIFVDLSFLTGFIVLIALIFTQFVLTKFMEKARKVLQENCDDRIRKLKDIFNGILLIKINCWEDPFIEKCEKLRISELKSQKSIFMVNGFNSFSDLTLQTIVTFICVSFLYLRKKPITAEFIVFAISYYMRLNTGITFFFIRAYNNLVEAKVSLKRIEDFLKKDETLEEINYESTIYDSPHLILNNFNAGWDEDLKNSCNSGEKEVLRKRKDLSLKNIDLEIKENQLVGIVGNNHSGKSALLRALIGEMRKTNGEIHCKGKIFYVPQVPWIFPGSLRQNILFGKEYNEEKYLRVINACGLNFETERLEENTQISENSVSGGQRARINMARALYSEADLFLFDDSFSSLDEQTANHLIENCINGYLESKIRILVTHQHRYLEKAKQIIELNDGEISFKGNYSDFQKKHHLEFEKNLDTDSSEKIGFTGKLKSTMNKLIIRKENQKKVESKKVKESKNKQSKSFSLRTYLRYFKGNEILFFFVISIFIFTQNMVYFCDYFSLKWASFEKNHEFDSTVSFNLTNNSSGTKKEELIFFFVTKVNFFEDIDSKFYFVYFVLFCITLLLGMLRSFFYFGMCLRSSKNLYFKMFKSVFATEMSFFEHNSLGEIMTRFTIDTKTIDESIPMTLLEFMRIFINASCILFFAMIINFWIIIPFVILSVCFLWLRKNYLKSSRVMKRISLALSSPIKEYINQTISGISVIRACKFQSILSNEFHINLNNQTASSLLSMYFERWLAIRVDLIVYVFIYFTIFACIAIKHYWEVFPNFIRNTISIEPEKLGVVLVYITQMVSLFQWCLRQSCELENLMISVERIVEYSELEIEDNQKSKQKFEPKSGKIEFRNVTFSYDKNNENSVLNDVSFTIDSGQKVGIVGNTGSGKSSIVRNIFRMSNLTSGNILIDDIDISGISLNELRSKISVVIQEPILFNDKLRFNLDPLNKNRDEDLWRALEKVDLKNTILDKNIGLDSDLDMTLLSHGEKQLICIARVFLKSSKIVIFDEATANLDHNIIMKIHHEIQKSFENCTIITIAHNLRVISLNDILICLTKDTNENVDRIESIGRPSDLIRNESIFGQLFRELNNVEQNKVLEIINKLDL